LYPNLLIGCTSFSKKVTFDNGIILHKETVSKLNGIYEVGALKVVLKFENLKPQIIKNPSKTTKSSHGNHPGYGRKYGLIAKKCFPNATHVTDRFTHIFI